MLGNGHGSVVAHVLCIQKFLGSVPGISRWIEKNSCLKAQSVLPGVDSAELGGPRQLPMKNQWYSVVVLILQSNIPGEIHLASVELIMTVL